MNGYAPSTISRRVEYVYAEGHIVALWETSFTFDRGFTGHEHYDCLHVINANARFYDPVIGRFFSPDPFVQAPDFTQNYNRYSYCLNNPVMFSDTDRMETVKKIKQMC